MKCGNCKYCVPMDVCGFDCKCLMRSTDGVDFEVSSGDCIEFYGDQPHEPCEFFEN